MSKLLKLVSAGAIAVTSSALLARVHPSGDAGLYGVGAPQPLSPKLGAARPILEAKCADCHSATTRTPVYGHFAPVSWFLEEHVVDGRKAMNLSLWDAYTPDQQQAFAAKIVQKTKSGQMPLPPYRLLHWDAVITPAEEQTLQAWAHQAPKPETAQPMREGDPTIGRQVFEKRCTGCHSLTENREGPRLGGVYGRPSASVRGFAYSAAISNAHLVWNDANLDRWLTDTDSAVPGNNMDFRVVRPQERKDLIAFFKTGEPH
jgi:cytochrome c